MTTYPQTERFLRYATGSCGTHVSYLREQLFEAGRTVLALSSMASAMSLDGESVKPGNTHETMDVENAEIPSWEGVRIRVDTMRIGQLSVAWCLDKPFEGTVIESPNDNNVPNGSGVIGLPYSKHEILILNTEDADDMQFLLTTYSHPQCKEHILVKA